MFICPGCKARFRVTKAPKSGKIKCPKCGLISMLHTAGKPAPAKPEPPPPPPPELAPNTTVAGHKILEYVGGSQLTAAYKASQISMGRTVLFRVLRPKHTADDPLKARFFAGARAAARLNHPNLLSVFDMGEEGDVSFYTTEFVEGGALPQFMAAQEKMSSKQRLAVATQIAHALAYAHSVGVEQVWLRPKDVLLTDKGDVRLSHVGTGEPLSGGTPRPMMSVLIELIHMTASGKPLPSKAKAPGDTGAVVLPTPRDALGTKFNAAVLKLMKEREAAYQNVGEFAAELQKLSDSVQRRSTVSASSSPGGVVPIRLEKAHRRELPVKTILVATAIAAGLGAIVLYSVMSHLRGRKAQELWDDACLLANNSETLFEALKKFEELADEYPSTKEGKDARTQGIPTMKKKIVGREYNAAEQEFKDKPQATGEAIAALKAARERLERMLPGLPLIAQQERIRINNVRVRYDRAAIQDWNKKALEQIEGFRGRMQYGKALQAVQDFAKKWPESEKIQQAVDRKKVDINQSAQKKFDRIMEDVDGYIKDRRPAKAQEELKKIIRNFGIQKYVDQAGQKLKDL